MGGGRNRRSAHIDIGMKSLVKVQCCGCVMGVGVSLIRLGLRVLSCVCSHVDSLVLVCECSPVFVAI